MCAWAQVRHEWRSNERELRWTDTRIDEQQRGMSIKMTPMTLVMEASSGKSRLFSMLDCPGHVNFNDEVTAAMRLADGVLLVVDAVEGVMCVTERAIKQAVQEQLPICLMISKVGRGRSALPVPPLLSPPLDGHAYPDPLTRLLAWLPRRGAGGPPHHRAQAAPRGRVPQAAAHD